MPHNIIERKEELKRDSGYEKDTWKAKSMSDMVKITLLYPTVERFACKIVDGGVKMRPVYEDEAKD